MFSNPIYYRLVKIKTNRVSAIGFNCTDINELIADMQTYVEDEHPNPPTTLNELAEIMGVRVETKSTPFESIDNPQNNFDTGIEILDLKGVTPEPQYKERAKQAYCITK